MERGVRQVRDRSRPDHWTRRAKAEGYAARSAWKLEEIDRRFRLLPGGSPIRVLDLGCAPGSWSQYVRRTGGERVRLVGVDLVAAPAYPGIQVVDSVFDVGIERLREALGGPADLLVSDMAPQTTGSHVVDCARQLELAERAFDIGCGPEPLLAPGRALVMKVFDGEDAPGFVERVRRKFDRFERVRPKATRSESREFFAVGIGFRR